MTRSEIRHEINEILDRVRWSENRNGTPCRESRNNALRAIIGLCNKAGASRSSGMALHALNVNRAKA